jgi:hypothetical protein
VVASGFGSARSGSLAILAAIRRALSRVSRLAGPSPLLLCQDIFLRKPEQWRGRLVLQFCDATGTAAMPGRTTIYDPPKEGLPYLVVAFTPDGLKITAANSNQARTIASEGVFRRRRERQSEQSKATDKSNVA